MSSNFKQNEYEKFMSEYESQHEACPKCGSLAYGTTLMGFVVDWDNKDKYKDKNTCTCMDCGDRHIFHDRVNKSDIRDNKLKDIGI